MSKSAQALLNERPAKAPAKPAAKAKTNPARKPKSEWFTQGNRSGSTSGGSKNSGQAADRTEKRLIKQERVQDPGALRPVELVLAAE